MRHIRLSFLIVFFLVIIAFSIAVVIYRLNHNSFSLWKENYIKTGSAKIFALAGLLPGHDTVIYLNNRKVFINTPVHKAKHGTLLVLKGWNLPPEDCCIKTTLCKKASEMGYYIVLPDMGKSIYQERTFPETLAEWRSSPTRKWLSDTLIPYLQDKYSLLLNGENNFIVGLSTGARGVVLLVLDVPKLFRGVAALSGDYDQSKMPDDKLMTGFYGPYQKNKERWDKTDNPVHRIKEFNTSIYLGHGKSDTVVPACQTRLFYDSLVKYHPYLKARLNMPDAGHDFDYWDSEVDNILSFFNGF